MIKFALTVMEAAAILALALTAFRASPRNFLNRSFALSLLLLSGWVLCGFPHLLLSSPSERFLTIQFRLSYTSALLALGSFTAFSWSFYLRARPPQTALSIVFMATLLVGAASLTDLVIRKVVLINNHYLIDKGPLYPLHSFALLGMGVTSLCLISAKRMISRSLDRARANYILFGFGIFIILGIVLGAVLPGVMKRDVTSDYPFFLVIIPVTATSYAMLKHRLLDVRVAMRKGIAYIVTLAFFGVPMAFLQLILWDRFSGNPSAQKGASMAVSVGAVFLSPLILRAASRLANRIFLAGLYDDVALLHRVSNIFSSTSDIRKGITEASIQVCKTLKLSSLLVTLPDRITMGRGNWVLGAAWRDEELKGLQFTTRETSPLFEPPEKPLILEERPWIQDDNLARIRDLQGLGLIAVFPLEGPSGTKGTLVVGNKLSRGALDPLDVEFLHEFARRAGLYVENYILSANLLSQFEELMRVKEELEQSHRFKSDIIAVTSHELRTPLTILAGFAYMLRDNYHRFSDDERRQYLEYIITSCEKLKSILDQFLTVSYFQEGRATARMEDMYISEVIDEVFACFSPEQRERLRKRIPDPVPRVRSDRSYLVLMIRNLVENALRFSPADSPVLVEVESRDKDVFISVTDYGMGIEPASAQVIFQPFARLEETDKHHKGMGLGLYIVRLIAELLGTEVNLESTPGKGTTFFFRLPLSEVS